jgi:hypothetical protein
MGLKPRLSVDQETQARVLRDQGHSIASIARRFRIDRRTAESAIRRDQERTAGSVTGAELSPHSGRPPEGFELYHGPGAGPDDGLGEGSPPDSRRGPPPDVLEPSWGSLLAEGHDPLSAEALREKLKQVLQDPGADSKEVLAGIQSAIRDFGVQVKQEQETDLPLPLTREQRMEWTRDLLDALPDDELREIGEWATSHVARRGFRPLLV